MEYTDIRINGNFWYKVNPFTKTKIFEDPPRGELPEHLKDIMLKELLKKSDELISERTRKLTVIKTFPEEIQWFFKILENAEFSEFFLIQRWINKMIYE